MTLAVCISIQKKLSQTREEYEEELDSVAKAESNDKAEAENNTKGKTITKNDAKAGVEA